MGKSTFVLLLLLTSYFCQSQEISIELLKDGFNDPLSLQHANDDRLFIVEQAGKIKILHPNGDVNATSFLDISGEISTGGERGLLGLAFHPDYANNGYFYVNYTKPNGNTQISRFSVSQGNPDVADATSELPLLSFEQPFSNHNGGNLVFGPDNFLYISSGDGGGSPETRAQDLNLLLGKILRIDVDNPSGTENYGIPTDNPFVDIPNARDEIWAYGLRNPWRFSFDLTENELWIGDVGQAEREEINRVAITAGGLNYGWPCYEGTQPFNLQNCPPESELSFPLAEYTHDNGNCSVTGGFVYRGSTWMDLEGHYFFADYCSGVIGTIDSSGSMSIEGNFPGNWVSFGEDVNKELYIIDLGGKIYKIRQSQIGIDDVLNENQFTLLPNPASDSVLLRAQNDTFNNISIFGIEGRRVYSAKNLSSQEKTISTVNLNGGIYLVKVTFETGKSQIKKLIVQ